MVQINQNVHGKNCFIISKVSIIYGCFFIFSSEEVQLNTVQITKHLEDDGPTIHYDEDTGLYNVFLSHNIDEDKLFSADGIETIQDVMLTFTFSIKPKTFLIS